MSKTVYFLQGLAHDTDNWDDVIQYLPEDYTVRTIDALNIGFEGDHFSFERAAHEFNTYIHTDEPAIICGLSYGSVIATYHAFLYPEQEHTYLLVGGQTQPPKLVTKTMRFFHPIVWKVIEWYAGKDLKRERIRSITDSFVTLDIENELHKITSEVVVVVGGWDVYHFRPAQMMLEKIERSRLVYIEGAHHETNHAAPAEIAHQIKRFQRTEERK